MVTSMFRRAASSFAMVALMASPFCAARPVATNEPQAQRLSLLTRAASSLQLQLSAAVSDQLSTFVDALTSGATPATFAARQQYLSPVAAALSPAPAPLASALDGYQVLTPAAPPQQQQTPADRLAAAKLQAQAYNPAAVKGERNTVLLKPDGSVFIKSWTWDRPAAGVDLAAAAAALQPSSGDAYASLPSAASSILCDGCIGADTRAQVSAAAGAAFPQTAIGQLTATAPSTPGSAASSDEWCTGTMISPRHVLTAAHCVFDVQTAHAAMRDIAFSPGRNGDATPFGTIAFESVRLLDQFRGQTSYTDTAANNDFAVITLAQPVGRATGWLGLAWSNAAAEAVDLTTTGYPDDKPLHTMWDTRCPRAELSNADAASNIVQHNCDSTHGQSGSPMFDADRNVRAILTGGNAGGQNWAVRVDDFVFSTVLGWMQEDGEFAGVGARAAGSPPVMELADVSGAAAATATAAGGR